MSKKKHFEEDFEAFCHECVREDACDECVDGDMFLPDGCCPLGGDVTDDCADCPEAGEYMYINGKCMRRPEVALEVGITCLKDRSPNLKCKGCDYYPQYKRKDGICKKAV